MLLGCTAGDPRLTAEAPAGFWLGLWHGAISWVTLVIGLFSDQVQVYEVHNRGGLYDLGFLLGVGLVHGGGSRAAGRRAPRVASRDQKEWEEIGRKVEAKIRRRVGDWASAEPDEDWAVIGKKAEDKLKRRLREWAEDDEDTRSGPPVDRAPGA